MTLDGSPRLGHSDKGMRVAALLLFAAVAGCTTSGDGEPEPVRVTPAGHWEWVGDQGGPDQRVACHSRPWLVTVAGRLHVATQDADVPVWKLDGTAWVPATGSAMLANATSNVNYDHTRIASDGTALWHSLVDVMGVEVVRAWDGAAWTQVGQSLAPATGHSFYESAYVLPGPSAVWTEVVRDGWGVPISGSLNAASWDGSAWRAVAPLVPPTNFLLAMGVVPDGATHLVLYTDGWSLHLARFDGARFEVVPGSELTGSILGVIGGASPDVFVLAIMDLPRAPVTVYRWTGSGWRSLGVADPSFEWAVAPASVAAAGGAGYIAWSSLSPTYSAHVKASDGVDWVEPWGVLGATAGFCPELGNDADGRLVVAWTELSTDFQLCQVHVKRLVP